MIKDDLNDIYALPEVIFDGSVKLTDKEFRVLVALYRIGEGRLKFKKTHNQISSFIGGATTETIRKATKGLRDKGLLKYRRTKRNLGRLSVNEYELQHPMRPRIVGGEVPESALARSAVRSGWDQSLIA